MRSEVLEYMLLYNNRIEVKAKGLGYYKDLKKGEKGDQTLGNDIEILIVQMRDGCDPRGVY